MKQDYFKNKKGIIAELFVFMILAFILILLCVIYVYIGQTVEDHLVNITIKTEGNWTKEVKTNIGAVNTAYNTLGWLSFMLIVFMAIAIFIGAYGVTQAPPVFFIAYIFVTIIAVIVSVPIHNAYEILYDDPTLNPTFTKFGMSSFFMAHLPTWITVIGLVGGAIMVIRTIRGRDILG